VPSSASTTTPAPSSRAASNGAGRRARQALEVGERIALQLARVAEEQYVDLAPGLAQQPRGDQPVAAVVALPADDRDAPGAPDLLDHPGEPLPRALHQVGRGTPRSSIAQASVARMSSASGSGVSQGAQLMAR
jgi:hypothetical protein